MTSCVLTLGLTELRETIAEHQYDFITSVIACLPINDSKLNFPDYLNQTPNFKHQFRNFCFKYKIKINFGREGGAVIIISGQEVAVWNSPQIKYFIKHGKIQAQVELNYYNRLQLDLK